jgi:hypothetical protein
MQRVAGRLGVIVVAAAAVVAATAGPASALWVPKTPSRYCDLQVRTRLKAA